MEKDYFDTFTPGDKAAGREPELYRVWDDGESVTLKGERALANTDTEEGYKYRQDKDPNSYRHLLYRKGDVRESTEYKIGDYIRNAMNAPAGSTWFGQTMRQGAVPGAALGAGVGGLSMLLLAMLRKWATGEGSPMAWGLMGALGGGLLGGYSGHHLSMQKQAAMYQDPKNVILEKLMSATDVGPTEKAKLAAAVRNMSPSAAQELAGAVRACLSFGVGALIAKFLFGQSGTGVLFGGLAGVLGGAQLMGIAQQSFGTPFLDPHKRLRYNDIL